MAATDSTGRPLNKNPRGLFDQKLVLTRQQPECFLSFARRYFHNGFDFAAKRPARMSATARLLRLMTTPALPPLLFYRRFIVVWRKKKQREGELVGYLQGRAQPTASA
ncbi:MAG TPA: hypothetical protein VGG72_23505 [Bryobacteraceae bacterium]